MNELKAPEEDLRAILGRFTSDVHGWPFFAIREGRGELGLDIETCMGLYFPLD